jgi:hypothetical protein
VGGVSNLGSHHMYGEHCSEFHGGEHASSLRGGQYKGGGAVHVCREAVQEEGGINSGTYRLCVCVCVCVCV